MLQNIVILSVLMLASCLAFQQNVSNRGKCFLVAASDPSTGSGQGWRSQHRIKWHRLKSMLLQEFGNEIK